MYHSHFIRVSNNWTTNSKGKRSFDILVAVIMLFLFAPVMLLIAGWLKVVSPGPIFYSHTRIGKNNTPFQCLKFRTMVMDAEERLSGLLASDPEVRREWETCRKLRKDPRIVPGAGTLLRKSSLDELPQIFNVLLGDMSIVGPRPIVEDELDYYGPHREAYLSVRPGLTGPWQSSDRSDGTYHSRVMQDADYVYNATLRTDISLISTTARKLLNLRLNGAY
jgi:lipopolysaccharide/colanic/teichoic acid biosynthesis glycosyltransferase